MFYRIVSIITVGFLISCASTTNIRAVDSKGDVDRSVKVYVDGQYKGRGEVIHSDSKIVGSTTSVSLRKEGCQSQMVQFSRNEQFSLGTFIGGLLFLPAFLWIMDYNPVHNYEFNCQR